MKIQELNVYAVPIFENRVLVVKMPNGLWEFPGGGVDWGEEPEKAAARELWEETSLRPRELKFLGITSATYPKGNDEKHSIYLVYLCELGGDGPIVLSSEHTEYRWMTPNELKFLKFGLNAEPIVEILNK